MAAPRTQHLQTYDEFYRATGVPRRDASMRRTPLSGSEERLVYWLYWRGDHIAAIARQMGIGKTTVLDRIHELYGCPSIIRTTRFYVITEPLAAQGRRKRWAFFCRLCGYRGEGPQQAGLQHVVSHFFSRVRAADLDGNKIVEYRTNRRLERAEREQGKQWLDYWERQGKRRGFVRRLLGS